MQEENYHFVSAMNFSNSASAPDAFVSAGTVGGGGGGGAGFDAHGTLPMTCEWSILVVGGG